MGSSPVHPCLQDVSSLWPIAPFLPEGSVYLEDGTHTGMLIGFRFCPIHLDIAKFFLRAKVHEWPMPQSPIKDIDVYTHNPEDLPITITNGTERWGYFFVYMTDENKERTTPDGCWKLDESNVPVEDEETNEILAMRNSFVFYRRELGPNRKYKTNWTLDEYRVKDDENVKDPKMKNWVVCKVETVIPKVYETKKKSRKTKRRRRLRKQEELKDDSGDNTKEKSDSSIASS